MQDQIVLVSFPSPGLDVTRERLVWQCDSDLRSNRGPIDGTPVAFESNIQPVPFGSLILKQLAGRHEVEVAVMVEIRPGGLVSRRQRSQPGRGSGVHECEPSVIS